MKRFLFVYEQSARFAKQIELHPELMIKHFLIISGVLILCMSLLLTLSTPSAAQALPEYAAQTGEPCSSCHISPSGGGPRGPRGQAWVASNKPGTIPDLMQSLELLGVELSVDPDYFTVTEPDVQAAETLQSAPMQSQKLFRWLSQYDGN